ncbi:MAG: penicillin amidase [Firmicutes bacterium]|nr:penicillin amidase [Bacillota bacterium]
MPPAPEHDAAVDIFRDSLGVPHIKASCANDAFFGQGFAHAEDRLWQMDCDRRRAQGRWAEYAGPAGVASDRLMRRLRLAETARRDYAQATPETRAMLDAYAAGVNAFLAGTDRLPAEYALLGARPEAWEPWHGLALYKGRHVVMGVWEAKLFRARLVRQVGLARMLALYPYGRPDELLVLPPDTTYDGPAGVALDELAEAVAALDWLKDEDGGSNNWVVAGSRTASGKPLLAGDPHRAVDVPNVYYQNHIACDTFDATGLSFPGLPALPHFGHNGRVAWCITHAQADTQDLFVERFDPENPSRYLFQGEWRDAEVRREIIQVRGAAPVAVDITVTHHGGVVAGNPADGCAITMRYTATLAENPGWNCLLPMLTARSCAELDGVMCDWVDPVNNLLSTDVDGNIAYRMRGLLPMRPLANAWLPVPGWTGEHEWQGMVPYAELPHLVNPACGYIVTANNRIVGADYPHYISISYSADFRARRIVERLRHATGLTPADMAAIHADVLSLPALQFLRLLGRVQPRTAAGAQAKALLQKWNGQILAESAAAAIYNLMREELTGAVLRPLLGPLEPTAYQLAGRGGPALVTTFRQRIFDLVERDDRSLLADGANWDDLLTEALERAVTKLQELFGEPMHGWLWGLLHQLRPAHALAAAFPDEAHRLQPIAAAMDGDNDTVQAAGYIPATGFTVTIASVARYLFDVADWERSGWVVPHGASGEPDSAHFADQAPAWRAHTLHPMTYDWQRIAVAAKSRQRLEPATT